jgi:hypothetical protein
MTVFDIDRRAQGTPEAFIEPPPGGRSALPKLDKAMQKRDMLIQKQHEYMVEAQRLREGLHAAREHDRSEAAAAAESGQPCPPSTAEANESLAAEKSRLSVALVDKINAAQNDVTRLVVRERDSLARDLEQRTEKHAADYQDSITLMDQARAEVANDVIIASWLAEHPAGAPQPNVMQIPPPPELADQPPRMYPHVLADLRRDAAELPHRGPINISDASIQRNRGFAAQEGGKRRWFKGASEAYWDVQARIAQNKPNDAA